MREIGRHLPFRIDGPLSDVPKVQLGGLNELDRKAQQILVGSFCSPLDATFSLNNWAKRGWGLLYLPEVFSLGKGRAAFVLLLRPRCGSGMKGKILQSSRFIHLWGVPLHVWNEYVFKKIVNPFGEYRVVDIKLLVGPNVSFVRVQISRFLGVAHNLFLIDVCLESNCTTTYNFHKSDQMAQLCEIQSLEEEWTDT
ncbi:hypothetical protein AMTRI_Chr13g116480 [Amborella trichopoda]